MVLAMWLPFHCFFLFVFSCFLVVQIQLRDKKTSYHFGHLDCRDLVYSLLQLMLAKVERNFSSEAALVDLGYIAVEVLLQTFFGFFLFLRTLTHRLSSQTKPEPV